MIEITKHGYKRYKGICYTCNCEFTYDIDDISGSCIICPDCGHYVSHYPDGIVRGSQFEDKETVHDA